MSGAERLRAPRSVAHAKCPGCNRHTAKGDTKLTGLLRTGPHLVWRSHDIVTWSGSRRPCPNSGIPICQTGATIPCPCGTTPP